MSISIMFCPTCNGPTTLSSINRDEAAKCAKCGSDIEHRPTPILSPDPLARVLWKIDERLAMHRDNLALWESGYLTPTEPDADERDRVKARLRAAIVEAEAIRKVVVDGG